jgi:uncharacterized protein (TIGR00299 family) protein
MTTRLQGLHLHLDPQSGIAGDMTVAALVDAGVPRTVVTRAIAAMRVPGLRVAFDRRQRGAFAGTGFVVKWPGMPRPGLHPSSSHAHDHDHDHDHDHAHDHDHQQVSMNGHQHRRYADIQKLLRRAELPAAAKALAAEIFSRIAAAESQLHGIPIPRIAFHEVGAFDSIADIVGAAAALAWLAPVSVTATPPVLGTGTVRTAHGRVAIPAPATAALLQGAPVRAEGQGELTTPTGAAILAAIVQEYRDLPPVRLQAQGFGAGTRELADRPNVLRVILGEPLGDPLPPSLPVVTLLQANVDDMSPQLVEPLMTALFAVGAVDAWVTSILMKKGRPALEISALAAPPAAAAVARAFFTNSTTLGVRQSRFDRTVLSRSTATVDTAFGSVPVKVAALDGQVVGAAPEFEDVRRLAARAGIPVREVLAAAIASATRLAQGSRPAPHPRPAVATGKRPVRAGARKVRR